MSSEASQLWLHRLWKTGVVAVVVIDDADQAEPMTEALLAGGVDLLELTLRTPAALEAIRRIRRSFPTIGLGVGTLLRPEQVEQVVDLGADFGVAPGLNLKVVDAARKAGLPFAPGVFTPSEIEMAVESGCHLLKFFPATSDGGSRNFKTITAPYNHLELKYIPLGGLSLSTAETFLEIPSVAALGGSWIAPRELIRSRDWLGVRKNAQEISDKVRSLRKVLTP